MRVGGNFWAATVVKGVAGVLCFALLLASCGADDGGDANVAANTDEAADTAAGVDASSDQHVSDVATSEPAEPTATAAPAATATPEPEPTAMPEPPTLELTYDPLPIRDDPCADRLSPGDHWFSMVLDDEGTLFEIPIQIHVTTAVFEAGVVPTLVLDFHPRAYAPGRTLSAAKEQMNEVLGGAVFVNPFGDATNAPVWSKTPTFNANLVDQLWTEISGSVCFVPDAAFWGGIGQGARVVVMALCETDLPMDYAFINNGMHFREGCDPSRLVPIEGRSVFTPFGAGGPHWDGPWTPPLEWEAAVGIFEAAPVAFDRWADLYNCTDERLDEVVADPDDLLERDSVVISYSSCDAPLLLSGVQVAPSGFNDDFTAVFAPEMIELLDLRRQVLLEYSRQ